VQLLAHPEENSAPDVSNLCHLSALEGDMKDEYEPFHLCLRRLRLRAGMTQQELADFATLSVRAVRDLERGRVGQPRRQTVQLLVEAMQLNGPAREAFNSAAGAASSDDGSHPPRVSRGGCDLLGREATVTMLTELLQSGSQRLITITGLPGAGKSWLANHVGELLREAHGWRVITGTVTSVPASEPWSPDVETLLIIDTAWSQEHSRAWDDAVQGMLRDRPNLRVLVAGDGMPLGVSGEFLLPLAPLRVDPPGKAPAFCGGPGPAVRHFLAHLRRVCPDSSSLNRDDERAIYELCQLFDGLPGAIEQIAEWCRVQQPRHLVALARESPLAIAISPADGRAGQGSAAAMLPVLAQLSYDERRLLERMADHEGTWSVGTAASTTGLSPLRSTMLVHALFVRGLVNRVAGDGAEFWVLNLVRHALVVERAVGAAPERPLRSLPTIRAIGDPICLQAI
jgi:transcriptional regulator with XRE-family HTH domain